jgi:choline dehydrogenase-like flavoprotein
MVHHSDLCIIGGGITAAMFAQKLLELRPTLNVVVVEAGARLFDFENRMAHRQRMLDYGENAWVGDVIEDQAAAGVISRTMAVGGSALHWGGVTNRFSEEDLTLRSRYGLATDWPIAWKELERYYCEAERRLGVSGEAGPLAEDARSEPYPMSPMPLSYNLRELKTWAEQSGIPFWGTPQAKNTRPYDGRSVCMRCNTCEICPTGARYSPDFTFKRLLEKKNFRAARSHADQTSRGGAEWPSDRGGAGRRARSQGRGSRVPRWNVRARGRLLLVASPAPPVGIGAASRRPREQFRSGRPVHDGPLVRLGAGRAGREDLSGHERATQPDLASVLPVSNRWSVRAARPACLGELRGAGTAA